MTLLVIHCTNMMGNNDTLVFPPNNMMGNNDTFSCSFHSLEGES